MNILSRAMVDSNDSTNAGGHAYGDEITQPATSPGRRASGPARPVLQSRGSAGGHGKMDREDMVQESRTIGERYSGHSNDDERRIGDEFERKDGYRVNKSESYASVWDAIADTPEEAANLRARAELMQKIVARLKQHEWTQAEAASRCVVTQPRINDLLRGRVSRFSLDALVNIATALGCRVRVDLEAA
jgi:predicted XRE-type DNA-binding protein